MIRALFAKEARANGVLLVGAIATFATLLYLVFAAMLRGDAPTMLDGVGVATRFVAPLVAFFCAERLFVIEHQNHTVEFLASLPVSPLRLAAFKTALGFFGMFVPFAATLVGCALVFRLVEHTDVESVNLALLQMFAYIAGWWGIVSFAAQLGRFRTAFIGLFVVGALGAHRSGVNPELNPAIHALAVSFSAARYIMPTDGIVTGLVLGVVGATSAAVLFAHRGGTTVRKLYETKPNSNAIFLVLALMFVVPTDPPDEAPRRPSDKTRAASAASGLKTADFLESAKARLDVALLDFARAYGIEPFAAPALDLNFGRVHFAVEPDGARAGPALLVDRNGSPADVARGALAYVLSNESFDEVDPNGAWFTRGIASYFLAKNGASTALWNGWIAHAMSSTIAKEDLVERWPSFETRWGPEIASAIAWQGVEALGERCGERVVGRVVQERFKKPRSTRALFRALERLFFSPPVGFAECRVSKEDLASTWKRRLVDIATSNTSGHDGSKLPLVSLTRLGGADDLRIRIVSSARLPSDAQLWWRVVDPFGRMEDPTPIDHVMVGDTKRETVTLPIQPREHIVATVAVWSPALRVFSLSGWQELAP